MRSSGRALERAHARTAALAGSLTAPPPPRSPSPSAVAAAAAKKASMTSLSDAPAEPPLFRFGCIADIQYCDVDDKTNATGTQFRYYRGALRVAANAAAAFNSVQDPPVSFVVHNGDIIDHNAAFDFARDDFRDKEVGLEALGNVLDALGAAKCPRWIFTIGNHELYNFSRKQLAEGVRAGTRGEDGVVFKAANEEGRFYYDFAPAEGWRVVVLDAYDVSIYSKGRQQGLEEEALAMLCERNPNAREWVEANPDVVTTERMSGSFPYFKDMEGRDQRWCPFNGGIGEEQLRWLEQTLAQAAQNGERVIVFTHLLIHPETSQSGRTLLWNYLDVLEVLEGAPPGTVAAVLSGHQHEGAMYTSEPTGTHYIVCESPLLAQKDEPGPFAVVEVPKDGTALRFCGQGILGRSPLFHGATEPDTVVSLPLMPIAQSVASSKRE
mmetsp:Transcript_27828/g.91075  ORF Transcript_27828/g.91075 Transcript_27828/m.91075 type:complete len:438 (+) Transcript_27828:93-1406(+)